MARVSRADKQARNAALREASFFELRLTTSFEGWQLPASAAYSGKAPSKGPDDFAHSCRSEVQRICSITLGRRWRRIPSSSKPPEATVVVEIHGTGLRGGPYRGPGGRTGHAVSGAMVRGAMSLQPMEAVSYTHLTLPTLQ